jgi:nucleoside-diphosphate-sugar epimerase
MRIFVGGASGYIGSAVAKALLKRGHHVTGAARSTAAADKLKAMGVEPVEADLTDPESFARAAREAEGVVQAASTADASSPTNEPAAAYAILAAIAGSGKPFVLTSGVWVYGPTGDQAATEETPVAPFMMVAWRPAVEQAVTGASGIRGIVVRPGLVYGNGGGIPNVFFGQAKQFGKVRVPGDGKSRWAPIHVDDLAELYALALEKAPAGAVLNGTNDEVITLGDIGRAIAKIAGVPFETWPLDEATKAMGPFAGALALDQIVKSPRARSLLGWTPQAASFRDDLERGSYAKRA